MIQDIGCQSFNTTYQAYKADLDSTVLYCTKDSVCVVDENEAIVLPRARDFDVDSVELQYAFSIDAKPYYLALGEYDIPKGYSMKSLRWVRRSSPQYEVLAVSVGAQLTHWYTTNRFCGACAAPMTHEAQERALRCPSCGNLVFPHISPAVIVGVIDVREERIVLTTYGDRPSTGPALIAGFAEVGESLEQTVAREVAEEVGLSVAHLRYYKSQPWPFSSSLLAGFFCEVDGSREIRVDGRELSHAEWTAPEDMPTRADDRVSLTGEMMKLFREQGLRVLDEGVFWEGEC